MTLRTQDDFDTVQEYFEYLNQCQIEKNAQAEAEMLAREANQ
jgi:hypothetical protein